MRIAGYDYKAARYHSSCVIERLINDGLASPAARDMPTEEALDQISSANAIDRMDEHSYDSGEFPKVVFAIQLDDKEHCDSCNEEIS